MWMRRMVLREDWGMVEMSRLWDIDVLGMERGEGGGFWVKFLGIVIVYVRFLWKCIICGFEFFLVCGSG